METEPTATPESRLVRIVSDAFRIRRVVQTVLEDVSKQYALGEDIRPKVMRLLRNELFFTVFLSLSYPIISISDNDRQALDKEVLEWWEQLHSDYHGIIGEFSDSITDEVVLGHRSWTTIGGSVRLDLKDNSLIVNLTVRDDLDLMLNLTDTFESTASLALAILEHCFGGLEAVKTRIDQRQQERLGTIPSRLREIATKYESQLQAMTGRLPS